MKQTNLKYILLLVTALVSLKADAQQIISLEQAVNAALKNNHLLNIKNLQVDERRAKVEEDMIKRYPSLGLSSTYQYNANVGELLIPQGMFGSLPLGQNNVILLPNEDKSFELGRNNNFNVGVSVYQPISQQPKIKTGIEVSKTDVRIVETERLQAVQQLTQGIEKLYYGLLINQKQQEEARAKLEVARIKLYDVESALQAGKTIDPNKTGLQASVADEEQNLLKLKIQQDDYLDELRHLTGLSGEIVLADVQSIPAAPRLDAIKGEAEKNNIDLRLAELTLTKTELGIKAAKQSYLPDLGLIAGYTYQQGNVIFPETNPFAGVNLKWNLQDVWSNRKVVKQRALQLQQAKEKLANTTEQVQNEVDKRYRQLRQSEALIRVAEQGRGYRKDDLKIQEDKRAAGLNTPIDILNARAALAKAEADLYAAQLGYRLNLSELARAAGQTLYTDQIN